ncbi:MAG: universal stress protein [Haloferacaceae archaeon]
MTDASPPAPFADPVIPVASEADAARTADAALPHLAAAGGRALVTYVVEKAGGAPDKASVEQREAVAEAAFAAFRERADGTGVSVETTIRYGTDVAGEIRAAAADSGASAIVFVPRQGSRWADLLTGNVRRKLVLGSDVPVVVLPTADPDDGGE